MSQQPPYGSGEPQPPYQPYQPHQPYGQGLPPSPYQGYPQQRDNTTRNVLLIIGGVILLFCGGLVAFFAWGVSNVDNAFDSDYPGSEDDPLTVREGEAFEIRGFDYESGWSVETTPDGSIEISGVRGTNNRDDDDTDSAYLTFRLYSGNEQLATVSCSGGSSVAPGRSVTLDCSGFDDDVTGFDEIEVYDTSYYE